MSAPFDITVAYEVTGFWGWLIPAALAVAGFVSFFVLFEGIKRGSLPKGSEKSENRTSLVVFLFFLSLLSIPLVGMLYAVAADQTRAETLENLLEAEGFQSIIMEGNTASMTRDGDTVLYLTMDDDDVVTFYPVTE